jgi:phytoene synthase
MKEIYDSVSLQCSRITTKAYSTSFSIAILSLEKKLRDPIYSIYGFVRLADEVVDTFHDYDKDSLLQRFRVETMNAINDKISLNPILNSFQKVFHQYGIGWSLVDRFLKSMEMDLYVKSHNNHTFKEYVLGSAEVVGLMCLKVFCHENPEQYEKLKRYAMSLGAAFQKVNFLRDLKADYVSLGRTYFPGMDDFDEESKKNIEAGIAADFEEGLKGIKLLPAGSRFGVYIAYVYYQALFRKIRNTPSQQVLKSRISIRKSEKATLLAFSYIRHHLNLI